MPFTQLTLKLYGKEQLIRQRSVEALARFLKGTKVRAVWCEFYDADKCRWSKTRLLLATELELTAEEILCTYRDGFDRKSQKFVFPKERKDQRMRM